MLLRKNRGLFIAVTDDELDENENKDADEEGTIWSCPSCWNLGIESILKKRIRYAVKEEKKKGKSKGKDNNRKNKDKVTFFKDMAELVVRTRTGKGTGTREDRYISEEEENDFRQCHKCGDIYNIKSLQKERKYEDDEEDYRDYQVRNWTPLLDNNEKKRKGIELNSAGDNPLTPKKKETRKRKSELKEKEKEKEKSSQPVNVSNVTNLTISNSKKKGKIITLPLTKKVSRLMKKVGR